MENSWYSFDVSPGWVAGAFGLALALSLLLYSKKGMPWSRNPNILMGFLRFSSIFLIALLILNPLLQLNQNQSESPIVVLAIDNSMSIPMRTESGSMEELKNWIRQTDQALSTAYQTDVQYLSDISDSIHFNGKTTNLDQHLRSIENIYEGRNLKGVILVSDGIVNQGQSPAYRRYSFPIYTLGLGDTIPPKDIAIRNIRSNRVAYQGNQFPVQVNIRQKGFEGEDIQISIKEAGRQLVQKKVSLQGGNQNIPFFLDANSPGLKRLTVSVDIKEGESSQDNNSQDIFVNIIEGKERILILAQAPHPDINAIRSVLTEAANYETQLFIPAISKQPPTTKNFDVIIEHQAFSGQKFDQFTSNGKWYILGDRINYGQMGGEINYLNIKSNASQKDLVKPKYNNTFSKFVLSDDLLNRAQNYPPVSVPFGTYEITGPTEVLFYQQVGTIGTDRPLMVFFDNGTQKQAVQLGTGIWQWRLQEASTEEEARLFKEYVLKTIQFLSIKANKDRFIVKPRSNDYLISDRIFMDTEVYNEIYERAYGNTIHLTITDEQGNSESFEMVDSQTNSSFNLGTRQAGLYQFEATTSLGGKTFTESGSFAVRDIQLESIELTANHNLLRTISRNTDGQFFTFRDRELVDDALIDQNFKSIIRTSETYIPLINSLWIILLITFLLSTEWFLRKFMGAY